MICLPYHLSFGIISAQMQDFDFILEKQNNNNNDNLNSMILQTNVYLV